MICTLKMKSDPDAFEKTARYWTSVYAGGPASSDCDAKVSQLVSMGFPAEKAREALSYSVSNIAPCSKFFKLF